MALRPEQQSQNSVSVRGVALRFSQALARKRQARNGLRFGLLLCADLQLTGFCGPVASCSHKMAEV